MLPVRLSGHAAGAAARGWVWRRLYLYRTLNDFNRMDTIVDLAAEAGIQWTREEFHWEWIEPERGVQDGDTLARYGPCGPVSARQEHLDTGPAGL